ncbi:heterokaryon incompatibility protein-domain-containing protein [Schizothecium vesticola]|uniref:Heterokaryon incompatibility protein-domain-containing protein n=1 Tax=Schizothecium vesticola TaxID=314040 RepID=A0AA40F4I6_9PEZI|nr:heterokaryon incompatibility protein-domain-containing protein [Schizothecium vesticola]
MAPSVYTPIDSTKGEIRLLVIEPATAHNSSLVCHLQPAFLSQGHQGQDKSPPPHGPQFEALSYTWGLPGVMCEIQLNGQEFPIQENAAAALRRLRFTGTDKTRRKLWVDAICINQGDIHEKEGQLMLMRKIYEEADQVCVWLGEPTESTALAIQDLQDSAGVALTASTEKSIVNYYMATLLAPSHPFRNVTSGTAWQWSIELDLEFDIGDIRELLSRPWWNRVWIVQEAVVGKKVIFMVGSEQFDWENVERSLDRIRKGRALQGTGAVEVFGIVMNPEMYSAQDETYQLIARLRKAWQANKFDLSIYELLYDFRHLQCTNQRDRVFGCLGLATAGGQFADIQPDYSSSTRDVFVKTALSIIKETKTLDILNCVRQWRGAEPLSKPPQAFSLPDQAKYHDVGAMVSDGSGKKARRGWARLPPGWERIPGTEGKKMGGLTMFKTMFKGPTARYHNHNTNTLHDTSPLDGTEPHLSRHPAFQRDLPPGWTKTWDNLGRAIISYDPRPTLPPRLAPPPPTDDLDSLPSWVPNCASTPTTILSTTPPGTLTLLGHPFDILTSVAPPWHPTTPVLTRRFAPVLEEWEFIALSPPRLVSCPYTNTTAFPQGRSTALWRTYLADTSTFPEATTRPLMDAWYDKTGWGKGLPELSETTGMNLWEASSAEYTSHQRLRDLTALRYSHP